MALAAIAPHPPLVLSSPPCLCSQASCPRAARTAGRTAGRPDPDWRWDGPDIPSRKPAWSNLQVAGDGRFWIRTPGEGVELRSPDSP